MTTQKTAPSQEAHAPRIPCPQCTFQIQVTLEQLLYGKQFQCPRCALQLTMDRESSSDALEMLQDLHVAMENVALLRQQDL